MKIKGLRFKDAIQLAKEKLQEYLGEEQIKYRQDHSCIRMNVAIDDTERIGAIDEILQYIFGKKKKDSYYKLNAFDGKLYLQWKKPV